MGDVLFKTEKIRDIVSLERSLQHVGVNRDIIGDYCNILVHQRPVLIDKVLDSGANELRLVVHIPCLENMDILSLRSFIGFVSQVHKGSPADIFKVWSFKSAALFTLFYRRFRANLTADVHYLPVGVVYGLKKCVRSCVDVVCSEGYAHIFR